LPFSLGTSLPFLENTFFYSLFTKTHMGKANTHRHTHVPRIFIHSVQTAKRPGSQPPPTPAWVRPKNKAP
jgi:hypothetical protein